MRVPSARPSSLRFNITPMIDIVFLLVIFFLVGTHFVSRNDREGVTLPTATHSDTRPEVPRRLVINIPVTGKLYVNGQQVGLNEIEQILQEDTAERSDDYAVQLRGDRDVLYIHIEPLLLACARHGVTRVAFNKLDR